jgi:hypothetical protein
MKSFAILSLAGCVLLIGGCKGKEAQFVGTWNGQQNVALVLKDDKTFTMGAPSAPQTAGGGHWKVDGDNVSLQIETIGGKPAAQALDEMLSQQASILKAMHKDPDQMKKQALDEIAKPVLVTPDAGFKTLTLKNPTGTGTMKFTKAGS